jgi:hypothetical protein
MKRRVQSFSLRMYEKMSEEEWKQLYETFKFARTIA